MSLTKIHFLSGLVLTLFISLHLANHLVSVCSIESHISFMNSLRLVYRNPISEAILMLSVLVQIASGVQLFRKTNGANSRYQKLHIWSGLYLAIFLVIHVSAIMGGRFLFQVDTNFYFGAAGLNKFPFMLFFVPYYSLAILSFFTHIACIHNKKMRHNILGFTHKQQSNTIIIIGFIVVLLILLGMTNNFTGFDIPDEYQKLMEI